MDRDAIRGTALMCGGVGCDSTVGGTYQVNKNDKVLGAPKYSLVQSPGRKIRALWPPWISLNEATILSLVGFLRQTHKTYLGPNAPV